MKIFVLGLIFSLVNAAQASEMTVLPLSPPAALLVGGAGDRQAATVEKFGQVAVGEVSLARRISATDSSIQAVKQHAKRFDFFFVPIRFGVLGFDGKRCRWLQVGATLRSPGADPSQVFLLDVFPATKVEKGSLSADGKVGISSDIKIATPQTLPVKGGVGLDGSADIKWDWSPLYQQVAAVYDQTRVIWRFDAVGPDFPVGETQVGTIIAVAKPLSKGSNTRLGLDVELRASFGGGWFDQDGLARANATVLVKVP